MGHCVDFKESNVLVGCVSIFCSAENVFMFYIKWLGNETAPLFNHCLSEAQEFVGSVSKAQKGLWVGFQ